MITVTHKIDSQGCHYVTTHNPDFRTYGYAANDYAIGWSKPNYSVPATMFDVEYDLEYVWLLHERARLTKELRDIRGDTIN